MTHFLVNASAVVFLLLGLLGFFHKKVRSAPVWLATATPLASIIGSGFLVSAPILILATGQWAWCVMTLIVLVAYALGSSIRFNIRYVEPILDNKTQYPWTHRIETLSRPILGIAYIISVAFYLKLLAAFALRGMGVHTLLYEKMCTTAILLFIGATGWFRGLHTLVFIESYAVNIKLAVIGSLLISFSLYNTELFIQGAWQLKKVYFSALQLLMLLVLFLGIPSG